mmetsp:Transcript_34616/g.53125  ORF Transcript_34616/g.53125 Transcript_34616/m.53125 type:complete len:83 (-) Transcript_34616:109-357(-)|eukprot:CAMPEP_0118695970 /NCGR_PEP_ID=MMETSP0800-20121206/13535_1 /TAXON_ID=210618 ORGANISM="Striatella unipunctata, Strain CCMP2910" /NCGR_SAMPLE_ID=MMETSP0800 /ASSEMBLY_ACC=CAM_ASM_000638 /LENGTH=82 /DNA_ID=CAMNT_0006594927 /DNA_START=35 /DNA_END=283 /DNA_ORIENTATION=+
MRATFALREATKIVNRNKVLFGPGPVNYQAKGYAAKGPLPGLYESIAKGLAFSLVGCLIYKFGVAVPEWNKIEQYYAENPSK